MTKSKVKRRKVSGREVGPSAGNAVAEGLLSPELMAELGQGDHGSGIGLGGALAVTTKPKTVKKRGQKIDSETRDLAAKINKSKAKKVKQIQDKKAKDSRRAELYRKLEVNRLSQEHMSLLRSSKTISQSKETLRSRIKQAVQQAIAGIKLEGAAVAELEAHPDMVADVEESLSLPVGGALIAATRRTPTGIPSLERVPAKADGKATAPRTEKDREAKTASNSNGRQTDEESGMTSAKARKGKGSAATTATASGAKRGRSPIPPASKPVVIISACRAGSSSDSCSDDGSEGDGEGENKQTGRGDDAGEGVGGVSSPSAALAAVDNAKARAAGKAEDRLGGEVDTLSSEKGDGVVSNGAPAESAGSWAAKMMSSLAHVATTKVTAGSASTLADLSSGKGKALAAVDASRQGGDGVIGGESSAGDMEDAEVTSEMPYPPPPSWLQGKAPTYRAVETPLPSASGIGGSNGLRLPRPKTLISVKRSVDLQAARMQLPVCGMEQEIMEAIHDNDTVILCGETGSGKSTQVPQFLYEAGYAAHGLIGVTQPRRVAAVGTAERVAVELGTKCGRGGAVAYQIRYDASGVGERTRVKFMTDGVLLREITSDILLRKYSVVLLDEAHERNLNTDVLLGMLSRSIPLRKQVAEDEQRSWEMLSQESRKGVKPPLRPLKLVIMSATLRVTDFTENSALFPTPPPVITATGREHKVFVHFNKRTALSDYVGKTFQKVCKIHRLLPNGGILVFLTGKREILHMCDKLRREFPPPRVSKRERGPKGRTGRGELNRAGDSHQPVEKGQDVMRDKDGGGHVEEAAGAGVGPEANGGETKTATYREKPRETNQESILFREADDDEEDAARLADMGDAGGEDPKEASRAADVENIRKKNAVGDDRSGATLDGNKRSSGDKEGDSGDLQGNVGDLEGETSEEEGEEGSAFLDAPPPPLEELLPPVHVVPLYAMLTAEEQARVFQAPPEGHRLIVIATNVAETSITIPGISYVVDCGRQKRRVVQRDSGISRFEVGWISRASADQRAGRSGRTGRGNCFRLFSSAVYSQTLEPFEPPDVLSRPLEDIVLQMKAMGIVDVSRFPFPTAPDAAGLRAATSLLANLGATAGRGNLGGGESDGTGEITPVGKALALLPVGARYAKMLLLAFQGGVRHHASAMVAMLAEGDPFVRPDSVVMKGEKNQEMVMKGEGGGVGVPAERRVGVDGISDAEEVRRKRAMWFHPNSDALARLKAAGAYAHATERGTAAGNEGFCRDNLLHAPTMQRALQLRRQLTHLVDLRFGSETGAKGSAADERLKPPSRRQSDTLRQVVLTGLLDNVARRAPAGTVKAGTKLQKDCAYLSCNEAIAEPLYIKGTSVLFSRDPGDLPEWVVYQSIVRGEKEGAPANMTCVTAIEPSWLPSLAEGSPLLTFSEPLASPPPYYDGESDTMMCRVTPRYGVHAWALPPHCMELAAAAPANKPDAVMKWFGRLLLEGGVAGCLSELKGRDMLNDPPSMLTRDRPSKKVSIILLELRRKGVCCLPALVRQWRENPAYLKDAVALWVKVNKRDAFDAVWAKAIRTAVLALKAKARRRDQGGEAATGGAAASGDSGNGREDKAGNEPEWKRLKAE